MSFLSKIFRYENENGESITFTYDNGFVINKPVGIDSVSVGLSQVVGIGQIGASIQSANVQPRPVNISGKLVGEMQMHNKEMLISVIRPDLSGKLYADDYYLSVIPTATPTIGPQNNFAEFQFSVLAAYPFWINSKHRKISMYGIKGAFKFPWNMTQAYRFGEVVDTQFSNIYNEGMLPVPFVAEIYSKGICVNPKIINVTTGKYILITKEMEPGERIRIETTHGRTYVISTIDGDIRGAMDLKSSLNRLEPKDNIWKLEAESGRSDIEAYISYATEMAGVVV